MLGMTTIDSPTPTAEDYLAAVQAASDALDDLYAKGTARPDLAAKLHQHIDRGIKMAEVRALLSIRDQLAALTAILEERAA